MVDFNKATRLPNKFLGSERKATIKYNGEVYMLKFPDPPRANAVKELLSYKNNQYSEHIGSSIFRACGFTAQETLMGYFTDSKGKRKIVTACKDFTQDGSTLYEMATLINDTIEVDDPLGRKIEDIYTVLEYSHLPINKAEILDKFWDMFVIDALIGNRDRHFGNWGLLEKDGAFTFAPIYDCGSSLSALLDDNSMEEILQDETEFKNKAYNINSCYSLKGKRIFYHEIFKNPPEELVAAIKRVFPKIDMEKVREIIDSTPEMPDIRKKYLKKSVALRFEQILTPAHEKADEGEK